MSVSFLCTTYHLLITLAYVYASGINSHSFDIQTEICSKWNKLDNVSLNITHILRSSVTVGPNGPKIRSWEHIWAYLCKEFSYSHHFWLEDNQWGYKQIIKPNWPWLTLDYLEMALEKIFFSACPSFNPIFSPKLCENEESARIRCWARHYRIHLQKNRYKRYQNDFFC